MLLTRIEKILEQLELRLQALSHALVNHDGTALELHCYGLNQLLSDLPLHFQDTGLAGQRDSLLKLRLQRIGAGIQQQREALARSCVSVDRCLSILLPHMQDDTTYLQGSGPYSHFSRSKKYRPALKRVLA